MAGGGGLGTPAGVDDGGGVVLGDDPGPVTVSAGRRSARRWSGARRHRPSAYRSTVSAGLGGASCAGAAGPVLVPGASVAAAPVSPVASTVAVSTTTGLSMVKAEPGPVGGGERPGHGVLRAQVHRERRSVPAYRSRSRARTVIARSATPSARRASRVRSASSAQSRSTRSRQTGPSGSSTDCSRRAVASARPMPYAERTPASGGTRTVSMPRASATAQTCWPPAPPKPVRA